MNLTMRSSISALAMTTALLLPAATAESQTNQQGLCTDTVLRDFVRLSKRQGKELRRCLGAAAKRTLTGSLDACINEDPGGGIARTRTQNIDRAMGVCTEAALDFGPRSVASATAVAVSSQSALLAATLGPAASEDAATALGGKLTARCRAAVHASLEKCRRTKLQDFRRCVRDGIRDGIITDETGIAQCADQAASLDCNPARLERRMTRCQDRGVNLVTAFPGCDESAPTLAGQCAQRQLECQVCLALNRVGFVDRDCDVVDDGLDNGSCFGMDRWGGHTSAESTATGRFRVEEIDGLWQFITPDGHGFFSAGVTSVSTGAYSPPIDRNPYRDNIEARYGDLETWREHTLERLERWNFNTMGSWSSFASASDGRLAHTPILNLNTSAPEIPGWPAGQTGKRVRDYFDPAWTPALAQKVEDNARPCADDPFCLGVFSDNEMPWGPGVFMVGTFLDAYMSLPANAPGKLEVQAFFEERYADVAAFNAVWALGLTDFDELQDLDSMGSDLVCEAAGRTSDRRAFMVRVAERYFSAVHDALRAVDPELLILGPRFTTTSIGPDVVQAAAPYLDVISLNHYLLDPAALGIFAGHGGVLYDYFFLDNRFGDLADIHTLSGRPMMITEYTMRVPTPDVPVLFPPYFPTYATQEERTGAYEEYQRQVLSRPFMVGTHWFQWEDQPETGRGDGENSHFGVVNIEDDHYEMLTSRMTHLNGLTSERPLAAPDVVYFPDPTTGSSGSGGLTIPVGTLPPVDPGALGYRTFSVAPAGSDRSGFYIGLLPGNNVANAVTGGPLVLSAGVPDANDDAALTLAQDTVLAVEAITGEVLCLRLTAAGSSGLLSCEGGAGHDVSVTRDTGELAPPEITQTFLGSDSGPGAATLVVSTELARLPPGSSDLDCVTTLAYEPPNVRAFTTATLTATKGAEEIVLVGENFECGVGGSAWTIEDGEGMFAIGLPMFDSRVPGGDMAAGLLFADRADVCP